MKHKKYLLFTFLVLSLMSSSYAQEKIVNEKSLLFIAEPFVMISGGFDVEGAYGFGKIKIGVKYRQTEKSDPIALQKSDFDTKYKNLELNYNYFLKDHLKGFFAGGTLNYFFDYIATEKLSIQSATKDFLSIGLRFGYFWYPFKNINLFIDPTLAINVNVNDKDVTTGGRVYEAQTFRLPPAGMILRIGYKF